MEGLLITAPNKLEPISKKEQLENVDSVKVKIIKTLFMQEDFLTFKGETKVNFPIIPGRIAIGKVVETCGEDYDIPRGTNVYLHAVNPCNKCFECARDDSAHCSSFQVAGKNCDGFLRDFAVVDNSAISVLPPSVDENDALFIEHVALCSSVIDSLSLQKGEHVVVVGGDILGIILAELIVYYQGIPILVDNNQANLELAKSCGVYYTLFADNKIKKSVSDLTGGRFSKKVVYMTGANLNSDIALKLAGHNATVCFAGFGTPNVRVNFNVALVKQLNFTCVTNGYPNIDSAINIFANKAISTDGFKLPSVKNELSMQTINEMAAKLGYDALSNMLIIDME